MKLRHMLSIGLLLLLPLAVFAQDSDSDNAFGFAMDVGLGTTSFEDPDTGEAESWNTLSLRPDFSFGKFGIGLALDMNFQFNTDDGSAGFRVRPEDWIPSDEYSFLELYLPIFRYVRYGYKGEPLYVKAGAIDDFKLGSGFIISNYANTRYLPDQRITGLAFDFDGSYFDFPYVGMETIVSNLAEWDLFGGRFYTRPVYWTGVPIVKNLQFGFTAIGDRDPYYFEEKNSDTIYSSYAGNVDPVFIWGFDLILPVLANNAVSMTAFADVVNQNNNYGAMVGVGGSLIKFISYGAQLRFLGDNFIPVYFDSSYDLYRMGKYSVYNGDVTQEGYVGWFASTGFNLLDEMLVFSASIEGPFNSDPSDEQTLPTLNGGFHIDPDLLGGFSFDAEYQKKYIDEFADFISPENALISATIGYNAGAATISMVYDLKYAPSAAAGEPDWQITSKLETSISLFQ